MPPREREAAVVPLKKISEAPQLDGTAADAEIDRLSKLKGLEYVRQRESAADRIGISVSALNEVVKAKRKESEEKMPAQGRALDLPEPTPWSDSVEGAELIDEIANTIRRYVVLADEMAAAVALWVVGTHCFDAFRVFPRLTITSAEKGSGKTTLLDVIGALVPKKLMVANAKIASLFRAIEMVRPTLLLDEADTFINGDEELRGIINAGHRKDGAVLRSVGEDYEPRQFSVWCPMAIGGIGKVPNTIEDRSIIIRLRRKRQEETVEGIEPEHEATFERLASMAARWAADAVSALSVAKPQVPSGIYNRAADNWRPLLAMADLVGGTWPARARKIAEGMVTAALGDDSSIRVMLLGDIRDTFSAKTTERLTSSEMVEALIKIEGRPWADFSHGKAMTPNTLARALKPLGIGPVNLKLANGSVAKGYRLDQFADDFARYLPPRAESNRYPLPTAENCGFSAIPHPLPPKLGSGSESAKNGGIPREVAGSGSIEPERPKNADSEPEEEQWTA